MPVAILGALGKLALKGAQKAAVGAGKLALKGARKAGSLALKGAKRLGKSAIKRVSRGVTKAVKKQSGKEGAQGKPPQGQKGQNPCKGINECISNLNKAITPLQSNTKNLSNAFQSTNQNTIQLSKIKQQLAQNLKSLKSSVVKFLNPINLLSMAIKLSTKLFYKMASTVVKLSFSILKHTAKFTGRVIGSIFPLTSAFVGLGSQMMGLTQKISGIAQTILDTFTGIPGKLESMFGGITSLIKSYSPAQAKQIEIAFGQLRATMGRVLVPLAPLIKNIVLNIAKFIKEGTSKIDIKKVFKWIVFFMFLTVGVIIAGVKLVIAIIQKIRSIFQGGGQGIVSILMTLQQKILGLVAAFWQWILNLIATWLPKILGFLGEVIPMLIQSIVPMIKKGIEIFGPLVKQALDIIVQALGWLLQQLPSWLAMLWQQIIQFVSYLLTQLPDWLMALGEYVVQLLADLAIGIGTAIIDYLPKLWDDLLNLLDSLLVFLKKAITNFIYGIPAMFSKLGTMIWNGLKNKLPGWVKRALGISSSPEESEPPPQQQPQQQAKPQTPQQQAKPQGGGAKQGGGGFLDKLGTPEGAMQGIANFFKDMGLEDVGNVFGDMANMFQGLFEEPSDTSDLSYEAKEGTTTSIEDIGKKAREAALTVNEDPQKRTADATEQTSQNTSAISQGLQALAGALAGGGFNQLAQQADANAKAIQALNKTNKEGVEAGKQDQVVMVKGIEAMLQQQTMTNELLMRMANSQKQVAEIERSKTYSFGSLNSKGK